MLIDFNLVLLNLTQNPLSETHLQIHVAPRNRSSDLLLLWSTLYTTFLSCKCFKSFLLGRICGEKSLSFLVIVFHHL